ERREQWQAEDLWQYGNGSQQSPINIQSAKVKPNHNLGKLMEQYLPATATLENLGYQIEVAWSGYAGSIEIEGVMYKLQQCHWHHPSEHTIDGNQYPLELHIVHQTDDNKTAVIGIIYKFGDPDYFLKRLQKAIQKVETEEEVKLGSVDAKKIGICSNEAYYRYNGSLTTSPYTEGVIWTVIKQVRTVTKQQVDDLRKALNW
ncbi:hypothetical protein KI387_021567, partial [Taxus chinensis]